VAHRAGLEQVAPCHYGPRWEDAAEPVANRRRCPELVERSMCEAVKVEVAALPDLKRTLEFPEDDERCLHQSFQAGLQLRARHRHKQVTEGQRKHALRGDKARGFPESTEDGDGLQYSHIKRFSIFG